MTLETSTAPQAIILSAVPRAVGDPGSRAAGLVDEPRRET